MKLGDSDDDNIEDGGQWNGIEESVPDPVDHEAEYIDEDKYTTVTVEEVDISRDGISRLGGSDDDEDEEDDKGKAEQARLAAAPEKQKKPPSRKDKDKRVKKKKKTFRYESPAERKLTRAKVQAKNSKQARMRRGD